ncbi:probable protein phosphatase 2C T23F11.1 isoform X2 [Drosophila willistoni]|uniref:probable protein phosphatase 2C T23F11.1 isoform X2 n=1 Tax=Drosophila willistoni TaxID=7260 RepID=UPI000C26D82A|nr:probable protein phosphatase 2C T23F11.1 isoform X2 [Drosophila willistoni]
MGHLLSKPVTDIETTSGQNSKYRVGSSCMQGWRSTMEDTHTQLLSLPEDPNAAFFGVFDGHGGDNVAKYAKEHLHKFVIKQDAYKDADVEQALKAGFLDIDDALRKNETWSAQIIGTTAVVVLIKDNVLYCANAGDSRCIACVNGELELLSVDHRPDNVTEMQRIQAAGDFYYKSSKEDPQLQLVTAYPDVEVRKITKDYEFILLACDGIWDVMSNMEVLEFCRTRIGLGKLPEEICEDLLKHCLAPDTPTRSQGTDNMTVILICLLNENPYSYLINRCKPRINTNDLVEDIQVNVALPDMPLLDMSEDTTV